MVARDGVEALEAVRLEGEFGRACRPDIVFLDLNLPRIDGLQVLEQIKQDPDLKTIPVIVLTSSSAVEDVLAAYRRHANCFISKPVNVREFVAMIAVCHQFWFSPVRLPISD